MYKRLAEVRTDEDVDQINEELLDRYGEPPVEVVSLLLVARFRARARQAGIGEVTIAGQQRAVRAGRPARVAGGPAQPAVPEVDRQGAGQHDPGAAPADRRASEGSRSRASPCLNGPGR